MGVEKSKISSFMHIYARMRLNLKRLTFLNNPFLIILFAFLFGISLIGLDHNYPVNDDWIFMRQVEHFLQGNLSLSHLIDPSFIFQGLLGAGWAFVFGFSFKALHALTILITVFLLFGLYKLLTLLKITRGVVILALLAVVFNPVIFSSVLTFMTENYFLAFFAVSIFFYVRFFSTDKVGDILLGSLFCGLSILIRQVGLVIFIAFLITYFWRRKVTLPQILVGVSPIAMSLFLIVLWPSYSPDSGLAFIEPKYFLSRVNKIHLILPYFSYFLLPLLGLRFLRVVRRVKIVLVVMSLFLVPLVYKYDIFPIGSVFYIEQLHAKSGFKADLSVFDSIVFKVFLSFLVSGGIVLLPILLWDWIKSMRSSREQVFLLFVFGGMLATLFISSDLYDRYMLPAVVVLVVSAAMLVNSHYRTGLWLPWGIIVLQVVITLFLTHEYFTVQRLKWKQVYALQEITGLKTGIFLDGTYTKYMRAQDKVDYTGLIGTMPTGLEYTCFIYEYTLGTDSLVFTSFKLADDFLQSYFDKPKVYERKKPAGFPSIKKHLDELVFNEEYPNPIYNLVGKRTFVGSFCVFE